MSSQTPQQSALELARTEVNEVYRKLQHDLDSLRTAPINKHGDRIDSIKMRIKLSQKTCISILKKACETSNLRMDDLENSLRAETDRTASLEKQVSAISAERDDAKSKYDAMKAERDKAQLQLKKLRSVLREAAVGLEEDTQKETEVSKQQNIDPQKGFTAITQGRKDISNEPAVVRKHEAELQADVETVDQRASSMEAEPSTLQSGLDRINKSTTDIAPSIAERSTPSQPTSTSAASITRQGSSKETADDVEIASDQQHPQGLVSQPAHSQHMREADRLFCQNVLHKVRHDLMVQDDIRFFFASSGISQPMNLTVIDDKLQNGAYMSVSSLREDFDLMIKLYKGIMPPRGMLHTASENLRRTFEDAWSALQESDSTHQRSTTQDHTDNDSESRGHKRKASTERPVASEDKAKARRAPSPSQLSKDNTQSTSLATGDDLNPALPQPKGVQLVSGQPAGTEEGAWKGKVTTTSYFGLSPPVQFHAKAHLVSVAKSPETFQGPWTNLIPTELCVQSRRIPSTVDNYFTELDFKRFNDMIILRLIPSSESEEKDFRRLRRDLVARERYAQINHGSVGRGRGGHVESLHLIPALASGRYPDCLFGLNHELLPPPGSQKALFLVVGIRIKQPEYRQVKSAWAQLINTLHKAEHTRTIVEARSRIAHHSLPLHHRNWRRMSVSEEYMTLLEGLPFAQSGSTSAPGCGQSLRLSYSNVDAAQPGKDRDIKLPSRVFVLGGIISETKLSGLVVVDLQHSDRPVWEICKGVKGKALGDSMRLLMSKLPNSMEDWVIVSNYGYDIAGPLMRAEDFGLKIERCGNSG